MGCRFEETEENKNALGDTSYLTKNSNKKIELRARVKTSNNMFSQRHIRALDELVEHGACCYLYVNSKTLKSLEAQDTGQLIRISRRE